ncbi:MAG: GldG family protein, partial [Lachnospiraceae bacterium]|nr:GldG family protein [Lachnospiraceae bacterium]
ESADGVLAQTLERYQELSKHIEVTYIDPLQDPNFANKYTADDISQNSIIVETDKRSKVIDYYDLYETQLDYATYSQSVTGYDGEGQLTSAISYCISDDMPKIYFIAGHNEYTFDNGFLTAIEKENIDYETISLLEHDAIPEDAQCVIIHAPENDFSADDADKVIAYLNNGGMVIMTMEYVQEEQSHYERILSEFGMTLQRVMIAENDTAGYYQAPFYLLPNIEDAEETSGLTGQHKYVMSPFAQSVTVPENSVEGMTYTKLLTTSDKAVLKRGEKQVTTYEKEDGDIEGPFCVGVKAQKELESGEGTLYVFTSAQMFTDYYDSAVAGNNRQLLSNIMGTIAGHEVSVSIPVKSYTLELLTVPAQTAYLYRALFMIAVPLGLLAAGLAIWMVRRKK